MNVFFAGGGTGGHLYPALAIARALCRANPNVEPFFIGARRGIERDVLPESGFPFELLDLHPLYRSAPLKNWRTLVGAASAWRRLAYLAKSRKPAVLVATGGYAAGVALAYASRHHIPIVIQEQNSFPGLTVRYFARRAIQIHLGFPEAAAFLRRGPKTEIIDSGNPVDSPNWSLSRLSPAVPALAALASSALASSAPVWAAPASLTTPASATDRQAALARWGFSDSPAKTLLIFGGSQGAESINRVVGEWIATWESGNNVSVGDEAQAGRQSVSPASGRPPLQVIWATGKGSYAAYQHLDSPAVKVRPYISPMAEAYAVADFALCRAGAMTAAELAVWGIPAILVPLPTAAGDHQTANAKALAESGAAVLLPQQSLTVPTLNETIARLATDQTKLEAMRLAMLERARPNAADDIARHILRLIV